MIDELEMEYERLKKQAEFDRKCSETNDKKAAEDAIVRLQSAWLGLK